MTSGVKVADVCKIAYEEIKKEKKSRYIIFLIKEDKEINIDKVGDRNASYEQFLEELKQAGPKECRYALYDFEYTHQCQGTSEATLKQKLFLMLWCPDTAAVKMKMLYSSSFDALKKTLATDMSEASQEVVEEKLRATDRQ